MAKLTFHGGVGEIGGNKILLEDKNTKIFLDFGRNFEKERRYFEEPFLCARHEKHLLSLGILPNIKGLYKKDEDETDVKAILLSHPHTDHTDYIRYIKDEVPIYCGQLTQEIITAREFSTKPKSADYMIANLTKTKGEQIIKTFNDLTNKQKTTIVDTDVYPYEVDHSVYGANAFIIHTSDKKKIAYTGDFRLHGARQKTTAEFVQQAKDENIDVLITEGTNIVEGKPSSEDEVKTKANEVIKEIKKLVLVNISTLDIERLMTFYNVAKENDRRLAISCKQAFLLHKLKSEFNIDLNDPQIQIFMREKKRDSRYEEILDEAYPNNTIEAPDLTKNQDKTMLVCSFYDMNEMCEIKPEPGSVFILSQSEPFNEEMEIEHAKFLNWLELYGIPLYNIHATGHILPHQLKKVIGDIKPKKAFLIHTERPVLFKRYISDLGLDEVICPEQGKTYDI
jgi:ribonuclease J